MPMGPMVMTVRIQTYGMKAAMCVFAILRMLGVSRWLATAIAAWLVFVRIEYPDGRTEWEMLGRRIR